MARVRTVREHQNLYGDKPAKAVGDEYELPDNLVSGLVGAGLVEDVAEAALAAPDDAPPSASEKAVAEAAKPAKQKKR